MQNYGYMGYPYSNNYGYGTYGQRIASQTQQMAQPQPQQPMMQMQPQMPMEMPIQDIKFVNKAQAEAYIVFPNSRVLLIDKDGGMAHLKTADNMGQSTTQLFKFEMVNEDGSPVKPQEPKAEFDPTKFVTIEEFEKLSTQFGEMKRLLVKNSSKPQEPKAQQGG